MDEVELRDPRQSHVAGRSVYRQPCTEPAFVVEMHGHIIKCPLRTKEGTLVENIHLEGVMLILVSDRVP